MTDTSNIVPTYTPGRRAAAPADAGALDLGQRVRLITSMNPYMADRPDVLMEMAQMPYSIDQLVTNAGQQYGMMAGDGFANRLANMNPAQQRSIWGTLGKSQQMALTQLGYKAPERDEDGWLDLADKYLGPVDEVVGKGLKGLGQAVGPAITPALEALTWVGDRPAHLYRTIRLLDDDAQWAALAGAAVGALGIAAAPFTGGLSLGLTAGVLAGGALLGGTAAAAIQNPNDWWRAFGESYVGERTFDRPSRARADELLGDPRLIGLAHDLAELDGFSITDLATELASEQARDMNTQQGALQELATRFGAAGTPEHAQAYKAMLTVIDDPTFQEAVTTLQHGKISVGRDFADNLGLDPDSGMHRLVSGATDAAWIVGVDPTLMLGGVSKWNRARRAGVRVADGADAKAVFLSVAQRPSVRAYHERFVKAFNDGNVQDIMTYTPTMAGAVPELMHWRNGQKIAPGKFTVEDLHKYFTGSADLAPLAKGYGTVRGQRGLVLSELTRRSHAARRIQGELRAFTGGLTDVKLDRMMRDKAQEALDAGDMDLVNTLLPDAARYIDLNTGKIDLDPFYNQSHTAGYAAGRVVGAALSPIPVVRRIPDVLQAISTQIPAGRDIALTGPDSVKDIRAMAELGRYMAMPSWTRRAWADSILFSDDPAGRYRAMHGWLDNALTLSGARETEDGARLVNRYLEHSAQVFGYGDDKVIDGRRMRVGITLEQQADRVVMPDLKELHRAAATGRLGKMLMGIVDAPVVDTAVNKIWKPAILLRIGFIPRAAGEEFLNSLFRDGFGSMVQGFAARNVGRRNAWREAVAKNDVGMALTGEERELLAAGWLSAVPSHIRPVARKLADRGWNEPGIQWMERYGDWVSRHLEEGLGLERAADRALNAMAGQEFSRTATRSLSTPRLNLAATANTLLLGNPYSWRRMIVGGVADDKIEAATAMAANWQQHLMADLGTVSAGPIDPGYDATAAEQRATRVDGELVATPTLVALGQPKIYDSTLEEYRWALQNNAATLVHDPVGQEIALRYVSRVRGGVDIDDDEIDALFDIVGNVQSDLGQQIMYEFMGMPRADSMRAMVNEIEQVHPELARALDMVPGAGDISVDDFSDAVDRFVAAWPLDPVSAYLRAEMDQVKALDTVMRQLDTNGRTFAGQMLRHAEIGKPDGLATVWRAHRADPTNVSSPFVNSWADAEDDMRRVAAEAILSSRNQAAASRSIRLTGKGTAAGDPSLALEGQTVLWRLPYQLATRTPDELIQLGVPQDVVARNLDILDGLFNGDWVDDMPLTGDRELADALWAAATPGGQPDGLQVPASVMRGRTTDDGLVVPLVKRPDEDDAPVLWAGQRAMYQSHLVNASTVTTAEQRAEETAELLIGQMRQALTRSNAQVLRARSYDVTDENGLVAEETPLFRKDRRGNSVRVLPGEPVDPQMRYTNTKGAPVRYNDPNYVDIGNPDFNDAGQVMWPLVGPILEDAADARHGIRRALPKENVTLSFGYHVPSTDVIPVMRSRSSDVLNVGIGLPEHVVGPQIVTIQQSAWERFKRFGFGKMIAPSIDAIARKPQAFHFFSERYKFARQIRRSLADPELEQRVGRVVTKAVAGSTAVDVPTAAAAIRRVRVADGDKAAAKWTDQQAMAFLRGNSNNEFDKMLERTIVRTETSVQAANRAVAADAHMLRGFDPNTLRHSLPADSNSGEFLAYVRSQLPPRALESTDTLAKANATIAANPTLSKLDEEDWDIILSAERRWQNAHKEAGEYASTAAINDMVPFIDSHEFKSQFAEFGKGFLPFWYAEENFLKRWARTGMDQGPISTIRKAQLGYMGLKQAGVVRTDAEGKDWFVYPGSTMMIEAVSKIYAPLGDVAMVGTAFQTPTSSLLPGLNQRFGAPSFSPLVSLPLGLVTARFPELEPLQAGLVGEYAASRHWLQQIVPTQLQNFWEAATVDPESNARFASAMNAAIAQLLATGKGPPEGADAGQLDEFMDRVTNHTRIIFAAQAFAGFFVPGPPSSVVVGESGSLTGMGIENPREIMAESYWTLVESLGIEDGTIEFLDRYPDANLSDMIVDPLAYTEGMTESVSGAPLSDSQQAMKWMADNQEYIKANPLATPWLVPNEPAKQGSRVEYAYSQQIVNGLRRAKSPDEFFRGIKAKQGATEYYKAQGVYRDDVARAELANDKVALANAKQAWEIFSSSWLISHPIFAEELTSNDRVQRRQNTMREMRVIVSDPAAPRSPHFDAMKTLMTSFDQYRLELAVASNDRSARGRATAEQMKVNFQDWATNFVARNPAVQSYWLSVLRPEASFD